jgi:hypothetical protein
MQQEGIYQVLNITHTSWNYSEMKLKGFDPFNLRYKEESGRER